MMRREWGLVPRCALIVIALTLITVQAEHTFLGCFRDKFVPAERDLGGMLALEETKMTPSFCESVCGARHQMKYFGLQYGMECWCGNSFGKHGQLDNSQCKTPCSGDPSIMCGGENMNSVYEITTTYTKPSPHPDGRPLLGLVMIVKDEAHTLPATLLAIKPWIDVYYILDTGSTDGTQDAIRKTLGPNGEVWEEPFIDYGRSRNRALEIAQSTKNLGGPPIFSLMLSADETVHNGEGLRRFCEEHRDKIGPTEEAYYVQMDVGWRFDSARLSRSDKGWRYVGRVHEYLSGPNGRGAPTHRVPSTYIKFKVTDEERRSQREYTILKILLEETQEKPHDTRSSFYLARTYNVVKNHTASLAEFQRRVSLGGWREEVYESLYAIGWQKDALKYPWHEIQQAFLDAHAHSPERAEPLYAIASHWYREKNHALAYLFASHAASLPYPTQASLWVQADVYGWQCFFIMGMTGIEVKKEKEGARALMKALIKRPNDHAMLQQLARYRANLGSTFDEIECEVTPAKCKNRLDHGPIVHPTDQPTPPGTHNTNELLRQPPTYSADHSLPPSDATPPPTSALPIIYLIIAFLIVLNVILVLALRKNKAAAACMPQVLGNFGDKQV